MEFRRRCRTHLTPKEERIYLLGMSGDTPRQPFELTRWAAALEETIDSGPLSVGAKKFDPLLYRGDMRDCHEKVDEALDVVAAAHRHKQETGHVRQLAVERCERVQLRCSQVIKAMLAFVKRADLARDLRGVGRLGRPPKTAKRHSVDVPDDAETTETTHLADSRDLPSDAEASSEPSRQPGEEHDPPSPLARGLKTARKIFSKS